jgi:hypothetical protein
LNYINEYISIKAKSQIKVSILNNDTMPKSSFFMYPRNDDDFGFSWGIDLGWNWNWIWNWDSWYGRLLKGMFDITVFIIKMLYSILGYYIMWIILHYAAIHLYPEFCAPYTILGFLISPFMVSAPHCIAMRWIISEGSSIIMAMWIAIGGVIINKVMRR